MLNNIDLHSFACMRTMNVYQFDKFNPLTLSVNINYTKNQQRLLYLAVK